MKDWSTKKKVIILAAIVFVIFGIATAYSEGSKTDNSTGPEATSGSDDNLNEDTIDQPADDVPTEFKSALVKAEMYSSTMHLSKRGVYDQLTSEYGEKFSAEAAQYAIDNVITDWNANALIKARSYQDTMNLSPEAIRDQLTSEHGEKFTTAEADYAVSSL